MMKGRILGIYFSVIASIVLCHGPVSAKSIKVLSQFPLSGPVGSLPELGWGYIDGMNWINGEGGGVNGKKITWYLEDFRYNPGVEVQNFNRYAAAHSREEFLMATGYITGGLKPLIDKVNKEEKIPWLDGSYSTEIFGPEGGPLTYPYYYSLGATYGDQVKILVKWIGENYRGPGMPRIGFVYSPTAFGRDGTPEGIASARKLGFHVVAELQLTMTAADVTSQCMTLRKKKAQYVILHGYSGGGNVVAIFFKTAKKILKKTQIMGTHYTTSRLPIPTAQEAYDDYIGVSTRPMVDAIPRSATPMDNPLAKLAHDFAKRYRPREYNAPLNANGINDMFLYVEGLTYAFMIQKAFTDADNNGELTRLGVKKALDRMVWDFKGTFDGKTFSYKSHTIPMLRIFRARVKRDHGVLTGVFEPISEWINTNDVKW